LHTGHAQSVPEIHASGILQSALSWQQHDSSVTVANPQDSGFSLQHARLNVNALYDFGAVTLFAQLEAEMVPQFGLLDAFISAAGKLTHGGDWQIVFGQHLVPFSRETYTPIWKFQFQTPAQLTTLTPNRQLGASAQLAVPYASWLELSAGLYNGDGVNTPQNLDNRFMYVGRIAFRPLGPFVRWIGPRGTPSEGGFGPTTVSFAFDVMYNNQLLGDYYQKTLQLGADAYFCWHGLSGYAEYLYGKVYYPSGAAKQNYTQYGAALQAGYLLPIPGFLRERIEVAFRFEAVAPNTVVPLVSAGDPTQARASYTPQITYYQFGHALKASVAYVHNQEIDKVDSQGRRATYNNDSFTLQIAGRLSL
jgi:hypothetical protein